MQDYAVIKIAHRQYIVEAGKTYSVDKFPSEVGSKVDFPVLALAKGADIAVGTPVLEKVKVSIEVVAQDKGEKVSSFKYKAKSRYRRRYGHRKQITTFKVLSVK